MVSAAAGILVGLVVVVLITAVTGYFVALAESGDASLRVPLVYLREVVPMPVPDGPLEDYRRYLRGCLKTVRFGRVAWSWS
jgi:hypothetical protein